MISRVNDTRTGLGASVWTRNIRKARRVAKELEVGNVWINTHFEPSPTASFGGHKESGMGIEWGVNRLKSFCNAQTLFLSKHGP